MRGGNTWTFWAPSGTPATGRPWFSYRRALKTRNHLLKHKSRDRLQIDGLYAAARPVRHGIEKPARQPSGTSPAPHHHGVPPHRRQGGTGRGGLPGGGGRRPVRTDVRRAGPGHPVCQTQNGPHRDDLEITLNGRSAAQFASEGQQRTIAISLKLAQSSLLTEETGHTPIPPH